MAKLQKAIWLSCVCLFVSAFTGHSDFEVKQKGFSIVFPAKPMEYESQMDSDVKVVLKSLMYKADPATNDNLYYSFSYVDYPSSYVHSSTTPDMLEEFFRISINRAVSNVGGRLLSEESIKLDGFPGKYTVVEYGGGKGFIHAKSYLARSTYYILSVISARDKKQNGAMKDFFDSFELR